MVGRINWQVFNAGATDHTRGIHLHYHAQVLRDYELSYPSHVYSTYTGERLIEPSGGRFWASMAIRYDAFVRTGGFVLTRRADFDQQSLGKWLLECTRGEPDRFGEPTYIFRWADTGCSHSQTVMRSENDTDWYEAKLSSPRLLHCNSEALFLALKADPVR